MLLNFKLLAILLALVFSVNSLNTVKFPDSLYHVVYSEEEYSHEPTNLRKDNSPEDVSDHKILPSGKIYDQIFPREVHDEQIPIRFRRSPADEKKGNVNVDVSRTRDQGTNIHVDANRDVWSSQDGRSKVEAGGHYDRNIGGRQPGQPKENYGGRVSFSHRWRRSPQSTPPFNPKAGAGNMNPSFGNPSSPHGSVNIGAGHESGKGMQLHIGANQDIWRSRNGMTSFEGSAFYDRNFGRTLPGMRRDNYGGQLQFNHRF